jgi:hypothetical protein
MGSAMPIHTNGAISDRQVGEREREKFKSLINQIQGAPEVGEIPDAHPRPSTLAMPVDSLEYAPTTGVKGTSPPYTLHTKHSLTPLPPPPEKKALRAAVANLYNDTYRKGKESQYTHENVCIVPGGRAGLSRVAAVIGDVYTVSIHSTRGTKITVFFLGGCASFQSYQIPDYTAYDQVLSAFKRLVPVPTA